MTVTPQERRKEDTSKTGGVKGVTPDNFTIHAKRNRCPRCSNDRVFVTDKRNTRAQSAEYDISKRRRHCRKCGHRWSTVEIHQEIWTLFRKFTREMRKSDKRIENRKKQSEMEERASLMERLGNHIV